MRGDLQCSAAQTLLYTKHVGFCQQNVNEGSTEMLSTDNRHGGGHPLSRCNHSNMTGDGEEPGK